MPGLHPRCFTSGQILSLFPFPGMKVIITYYGDSNFYRYSRTRMN